MLESAKMMGFLLTTDYEKAKAFFVGKLGFRFISLDQFAIVVDCGQNLIRISEVEKFSPLQGTVLGWQVSDIHAVVESLKQNGVTPEKYPFMKDSYIWSAPGGAKIAWFKDPDGNVLSVSQHP
ncbi:MAG TPA: VOC family protein [Terriglobales bacterium]|nr:VOC family protein [Terriglobales bacterium]